MKIGGFSVFWNGGWDCVRRAIEEWKPGEFATEREYRDNLAQYLRNCAPRARVETEYRHAGTTIDVYFEWKSPAAEVYMELKRNLSSKGECDRLVGQIETIDPKKRAVIVVLCGPTKIDLLERLKQKYSEQLYQPGYILLPSGDGRLAIITKE